MSSFGFVAFPSFPSSSFSLFLPVFLLFHVYPFAHSFPFLPTTSETSQSLLLLQCFFLYRFLFTHHFSFVHQVYHVRGIDDLLSTSSDMTSCCHVSAVFYADCYFVDHLHVDCHVVLLKHVIILLLELSVALDFCPQIFHGAAGLFVSAT